MGTLLNRRRYMGGKSLPYDAEIEYLKFVNNCSIDTGIKPSTNYKYYWKYLWESKVDYNYLFSNMFTKNNWFMFAGTEKAEHTQIHIQSWSTEMGSEIILNTLYDGSFMHTGNNMVISANGTTMATLAYRNFTAPNNLLIRVYRDNCAVRIYDFSIRDSNDMLLVELIPVRKGTVGYMYDKVSGQLFGNEGTGSFILGPDKT